MWLEVKRLNKHHLICLVLSLARRTTRHAFGILGHPLDRSLPSNSCFGTCDATGHIPVQIGLGGLGLEIQTRPRGSHLHHPKPPNVGDRIHHRIVWDRPSNRSPRWRPGAYPVMPLLAMPGAPRSILLFLVGEARSPYRYSVRSSCL